MGLSFLYMQRVNASVFQYRVDFDFKVKFFFRMEAETSKY